MQPSKNLPPNSPAKSAPFPGTAKWVQEVTAETVRRRVKINSQWRPGSPEEHILTHLKAILNGDCGIGLLLQDFSRDRWILTSRTSSFCSTWWQPGQIASSGSLQWRGQAESSEGSSSAPGWLHLGLKKKQEITGMAEWLGNPRETNRWEMKC